MTISGYPGHMHKTRKALRAAMADTDVVIEMLDARAPGASINPLLAALRGPLPCLAILNKCDLADPDVTGRWQDYLNSRPGTLALTNERDHPLNKRQLTAACKQLTGNRHSPARMQQVLITGIPNVGKSTLLNQLLNRKLAKTGNEPAITRHLQRARLDDGWVLVDTPGMLWPKLEDQDAAFRLAALGTIRNTAIDMADVGWLLRDFYPRLAERYALRDRPADAEALLTCIARAQGCLSRGGSVDWYRVSELLLDDLRSGRLGRISLEQPPETSEVDSGSPAP